jgi:hypothetical protein
MFDAARFYVLAMVRFHFPNEQSITNLTDREESIHSFIKFNINDAF